MSQSYHRFGTISQSLHLTTFEFKIVFNTEKEVWPKLTQNRLFTKDDVDVGANHFCRRKNEAALAQETDNEQPKLFNTLVNAIDNFNNLVIVVVFCSITLSFTHTHPNPRQCDQILE